MKHQVPDPDLGLISPSEIALRCPHWPVFAVRQLRAADLPQSAAPQLQGEVPRTAMTGASRPAGRWGESSRFVASTEDSASSLSGMGATWGRTAGALRRVPAAEASELEALRLGADPLPAAGVGVPARGHFSLLFDGDAPMRPMLRARLETGVRGSGDPSVCILWATRAGAVRYEVGVRGACPPVTRWRRQAAERYSYESLLNGGERSKTRGYHRGGFRMAAKKAQMSVDQDVAAVAALDKPKRKVSNQKLPSVP